jgi:5-hydroxyisourate hydrolase-like protein (transthyretin family)
MNKETWKKVAVILVFAILFVASSASYVPSAVATPSITSLLPTSGHVGDNITVSGTIDTANGTFTIRWDGATNVTTGKAVDNEVNTTFVVPATTASPSGRSINVELIDNNASSVASDSFTLYTQFLLRVDKPSSPKQLQEGNATNIRVNVTGGLPNTAYAVNVTVKNPANQTRSAVMSLSNTTTTGSGGGTKVCPTDVGGAHTNLTGTYFVSSNVTVEVAEFFVGLTDKTEYRRNENVQVQAAGYKSSEVAKVDIKIGELSVVGFPKNFTADPSGLIKLSWKVPVNATPGTYRIRLTNATLGGTFKAPSDAQDFEVLGVICLVQATVKNLADEAIEGALIEVYNASATAVALNKGNTNSTGWVRFNLDSGNYTFKAFVRNVQVGALLNQVVVSDTELDMPLSLVNFLATVKTETGDGVPLIDVALRDNKTVTEKAVTQTNSSGMATIRHLFTNRTYIMEARRYGLLFSNTTVLVESSPALPWIIRNLTLPNHALSVHAVDSKGSDASGVDVRVYEWASGVAAHVDRAETNLSGDVFFSLPFGRYVLRAFKGDDFLREITVDLDEPSALTFELKTFNLDVTVLVLDYLGQPIPNAEVKLERKIGHDFALISTKFTDGSGSARFDEIIGGDSRVSVHLGGKLVAVKAQSLAAGSNEMAFRVSEYVAVLGYPIATGTFALVAFILAVIVISLVAARRRVMQRLRKPSKR